MDPFIFRPASHVADKLQRHFEDFEEEYFRPRRMTDRQELHTKREIDIHAAIMQTFVVNDPDLPVSRLNSMQMNITTRLREGTRGRAKQYRAARHNMTYRRALRNWIFNKYLAEVMGVPFDDLPPVEPPVEMVDLYYIPVEALEMLMRFELWTKYQLPNRAYVLYTREDRQVLSEHFPTTHKELGTRCVKFEDYVILRKNDDNKDLIDKVLDEHYMTQRAKHAA